MYKEDDISKCHLTSSRMRTLRFRNDQNTMLKDERHFSSTPPPPQFQSRRVEENIVRRLNLRKIEQQDFVCSRENRHSPCSAPLPHQMGHSPPKCFSAGSTFCPNPSSYPFLPSTSFITPRSEEICGCRSGESPLVCVPRSAGLSSTSSNRLNSINFGYLGKSSASINRRNFYREGNSKYTNFNDNFSLSFKDYFKYAHGETQTEIEKPEQRLKQVQRKNKTVETISKSCSDKANNTAVSKPNGNQQQKTQTRIQLAVDTVNQTEIKLGDFLPSPTENGTQDSSSKKANIRKVDGHIDDDTFSDSETPLRKSVAFCSLKRDRDQEHHRKNKTLNKSKTLKLPSLSSTVPRKRVASASTKPPTEQPKNLRLASCAFIASRDKINIESFSQESISLIPPPPEFSSEGPGSPAIMPVLKLKRVESRKRRNVTFITSESSITGSECSDSSSGSKTMRESLISVTTADNNNSLNCTKSGKSPSEKSMILDDEPDYPSDRFDYFRGTEICEMLSLKPSKPEEFTKITDEFPLYHEGHDYPVISETGDSAYSNNAVVPRTASSSASRVLKSSCTIVPKRSHSTTSLNGDFHEIFYEYEEEKVHGTKPWELSGDKIRNFSTENAMEGMHPQTYAVLPVMYQPKDCLQEIVIKKCKDGRQQRVTFYTEPLEECCDCKPTKSSTNNKTPKPIIICPPSAGTLRGCRKPIKKCECNDNRFAPIITPLKPCVVRSRHQVTSPCKKKPSAVYVIKCSPSEDQTGCNSREIKFRSPSISECRLAECGICIVLPPKQHSPSPVCGTCRGQCSPNSAPYQPSPRPCSQPCCTSPQPCSQPCCPSPQPCRQSYCLSPQPCSQRCCSSPQPCRSPCCTNQQQPCHSPCCTNQQQPCKLTCNATVPQCGQPCTQTQQQCCQAQPTCTQSPCCDQPKHQFCHYPVPIPIPTYPQTYTPPPPPRPAHRPPHRWRKPIEPIEPTPKSVPPPVVEPPPPPPPPPPPILELPPPILSTPSPPPPVERRPTPPVVRFPTPIPSIERRFTPPPPIPPKLSDPPPPKISDPPPPRISDPPPLRISDPPPLRISDPPPLRISDPPVLSIWDPPTLRISDPPPLRIWSPPSLRISDPPPLRISSTPSLRISYPPSLRMSDPPPLRISEPPPLRISEPIEPPPPPQQPSIVFDEPEIFDPPTLIQPPSLERLPDLPNMTREEQEDPNFSVILPPFLPPMNLVTKISSPILIPPDLVQIEEPEDPPPVPPVFEPKISLPIFALPEPIDPPLLPIPPTPEPEPEPPTPTPPIVAPTPPVVVPPPPPPQPVQAPPQPTTPPPGCVFFPREPDCCEEIACDDNPCFNYDCCERGCSCSRGITPPRPPRIKTTGTTTKRPPFIIGNGGNCNRSNDTCKPRRRKDRCNDRDQWNNNCSNSCSKRVNKKKPQCCEPREFCCEQRSGNTCNFPGNVSMFMTTIPPGGYIPPGCLPQRAGIPCMPPGVPPIQPGQPPTQPVIPQNPGINICPPSYVPCPCPPESGAGQWFPQQTTTGYPPQNTPIPMQLPPEFMNQMLQFMSSSPENRKPGGVPIFFQIPQGSTALKGEPYIGNIPPEMMKQLAQFANPPDSGRKRPPSGGMMGFFANPWASNGPFGTFPPPSDDAWSSTRSSLSGADYMRNIGGAPVSKNGRPFIIMPTTVPLNTCGQSTTCGQVNPCMTQCGPLNPCQGRSSCKRRVTGGRKC
ncbi:unnamed protein product [Allacma fusca]|uniref:Uncharacterized protein n=1 Tax=Allacma fusca TaxID=39272 RepID=A0A8J2PWY8_9HEXA|nr:unnamed protein product [Allacma fusca]